MNIHPYLLLVPHSFLSALYLRLSGISRRVRVILTSLLFVNLALPALLSALGQGWEWPEEFLRWGEWLLTVIAAALTLFISWAFRIIDFAVHHPLAFAAPVGPVVAILLVILFRRRQSGYSGTRCLALIPLAALAVTAAFILLYPIITPGRIEASGAAGLIGRIMEGLIAAGVAISNFIAANAVAARRVLPAAALVLALVLLCRKTRSASALLLIAAVTLALLAQSFIITRDFPEAIYLYAASGLLLAAAQSFRPFAGSDPPAHSPKPTILLTTILVGAVFFGLYRLEDYPVRYHPDEAVGGTRILEAAQDWDPAVTWREAAARSGTDPAVAFLREKLLFSAHQDPRTPLASHLAYLCLRIFPINYITFRASVVLTGVLSIFFFYLTVRLIFGVYPGLLAALLLAASSWLLALNRLYMPHSVTFLYATICLYLFWKTQKSGGLFYYLLLALVLAFSAPFYATFKMIHLLLPTYFLYRCLVERGYLRRHLPGVILLLFTLIGLLQAQGLDPVNQFLFYSHEAGRPRAGADTIFQQQDYMSVTETIGDGGRQAALAVRNLTRRAFDPSLFRLRRQNYIERGMHFDYFLLPFSVLGFAWGLIKFKTGPGSFLIFWLAFAMFPNIVTGQGLVDRRTVLIVGPMAAAAAVALYTAWADIFPRLLTGTRSYRWSSATAAGVFGFVILAISSANYFHAYYANEDASNYELRVWQQLKEIEYFLDRALDGPDPVYFLDDRVRPYFHHEVRHYINLRRFKFKDGKFIQRAFEANSQKAIDRNLLRAAGDGGLAVIGTEAEREFIEELAKLYPRSESFSFRWAGSPPFGIVALVVENRAETENGREGR